MIFCRQILFYFKVSLACLLMQRAIEFLLPSVNDLSFVASLLMLSLFGSLSFYLYGFLIEFVIKPKIADNIESYSVRTVKVARQSYPLPTLRGVLVGEFKSLVVNSLILTICHQRRRENNNDSSSSSTLLWQQFAFYFLAIASADLLFYWSHRSLHHGSLYWIHKTHHEFRDTSSFVAGHKSLVEYCITTITDIGAICFVGANASQLIAWYVIGALYNLEGHSSLSLLFMNSNFHDLHHTEFKENYGVYDLWDSLFGTLHKNTSYFVTGSSRMPATPFVTNKLSLSTSIFISFATEASILTAMNYYL